MASTILIVADDLIIRHTVTTAIASDDLITISASYGSEAIHAFIKSTIDLVIIDKTTITPRAKTTYSDIMKRYPHIPIITIVTTTDNDISSDLGEQITLPIAKDELVARITSLIEKRNSTELLRVADLTVNSRTLDVKRAGREIELTPQEFKLLHYLMMNKGRIVTREMILNRIWQYSSDIETRVVDVYMGYLRKKIDKAFDKKLLYSVRGFGYVIKE